MIITRSEEKVTAYIKISDLLVGSPPEKPLYVSVGIYSEDRGQAVFFLKNDEIRQVADTFQELVEKL